MCTYLKNNRLFINKKPFVVFKVSYNTDRTVSMSCFKNFLYNTGKKYNSTIGIEDIDFTSINSFRSFLCRTGNYLYNTSSGFYSYIPDVKYDIEYTMLHDFYINIGNSRCNIQSYDGLHRLVIAAFVVPEDSTYIIEDGVCISDSLIYTGKFICPFKFGFSMDNIKNFLKKIKNINLDKYVSIS